jgi:hypothetical protein
MDILAVNPRGQVPTLIDNGVVVRVRRGCAGAGCGPLPLLA